MKNKIILVIILIFSNSCAHKKEIAKAELIRGSCENEFKATPLPFGKKIVSGISEVGGKVASYTVSGLGYSTDLIIRFGGGVMTTVLVCSPLILADMADGYNHNPLWQNHSGPCLEYVGNAVFEKLHPQLGPGIHTATSKWRCPELDSVAQGLSKVASCYEAKGEHELATQQMSNLNQSWIFQQCLSKNEKENISNKLKFLNEKST